MLTLLTCQLTVEVIGYCGRVSAINATAQLGPLIVQAAFILVPPAFFAATIYMCLGRIIRLVGGDHLSIINPRIVTKVFVTGDYLSILIQGGAAGLTKPKLHTISTALVLFGLGIQLISFIFFGLCAIIFHKRIRRTPTPRSCEVDPNWIQTLYMLYAVSVLILVRSIFRIIEYAFGNNGYPLKHEWTLYCFDSVLMFLVTVIFLFRYPSNLVPKSTDDRDAIQLESQATGDTISTKRWGKIARYCRI